MGLNSREFVISPGWLFIDRNSCRKTVTSFHGEVTIAMLG